MEGLRVDSLTVTADTDSGEVAIVRDLCFAVPFGSSLAITGSSGSGKTMTANAILALLPANCHASGSVMLGDCDLLRLRPAARRRMLGGELVYIPQSGADSLTPTMTVGVQLAEAVRMRGVRGRQAVLSRSRELLSAVGLVPDELLHSYPFQLSGGMAQRVTVAIGMAGSPRLVIADEPTRGVDDETAALFMDSLRSSFGTAALVIITHSMSVAASCDARWEVQT